MKFNINKILFIAVVNALFFTACTKDLDRKPTNDVTGDVAFKDIDGYKKGLARVYGSISLTGNDGPGSADFSVDDAGKSDFLRLFWNMQELPTEEAKCAWVDNAEVAGMNTIEWTPNNPMVKAMYNRSLYAITIANNFIKEADPGKVSDRGISGKDASEIVHFKAETRFVRAYQYWVLMDLFGNPPFVTEKDPIGAFVPPQIKRADLFNYIESELKDIEKDLYDAKQNEYGRADKAAAWALLSRMYLNAEVYIGQQRYTDAITYASKVIGAGYQLKTNYRELFLADNNKNNPEVIYPLCYDGILSQNWGGTTYILNAAITGDGSMDKGAYGVPGGGWGGNRSTVTLLNTFNVSVAGDKREIFDNTFPTTDISALQEFKQGVHVVKFQNILIDSSAAPSAGGSFCSIDFPVFRLAEMYMIYAEAVLRGGTGGDKATAITYINNLRARAYGNTSANVTNIELSDILAERMKEFYWEGFRRCDLIRYGLFTSPTYSWQWKGGVKNGTGVDSKFNLYPLPTQDLLANPNLNQNTGY